MSLKTADVPIFSGFESSQTALMAWNAPKSGKLANDFRSSLFWAGSEASDDSIDDAGGASTSTLALRLSEASEIPMMTALAEFQWRE